MGRPVQRPARAVHGAPRRGEAHERGGRVLARRGARIVGLARTVEKAARACEGFGPDAVPVACELSEPDSVRNAVDEIRGLARPIDVLLCNAGIMALPQREIVHGQEKQFLTNHIGHFILVTGLLPELAPRSRVVILASAAHGWAPPGGIQFDDLTLAKGYTPNRAYGQSKLANILFARALARRLSGTDKTANAVHPGVIATNLARHLNPVVRVLMPVAAAVAMKSVAEGAATQCYVAVHPGVEGVSGEYFADCNVARSSRHARDAEMGERLWEVSEEIVSRL